MKNTLVALLICINLGLVVALLFGPATTPAEAQVIGGGADYLMVTGQIGTNWDGVYVIDLDSRRLLALRWDKTQKRMLAIRGRSLTSDFGRRRSSP